MKYQKTVKPFDFKDLSKQDVVDILNKEYPINLKYNESLIDRIYIRYPLVSKAEISLIVKLAFQSFRDLLVLGKVLNFNNLFFDTKLLFFSHVRDSGLYPSLKVHISMPPPMKK
jgi:hypothetical protein